MVALYIGFDPGGTGRKIAHVAAAIDDDDRLFIGHLRDRAFANPGLQFSSFPYLDAATLGAIEDRLRTALASLLALTGPCLAAGDDPLASALSRFDSVVVSVDAPSGFAIAGNSVRHTESAVNNFNTPNEATFLSSAMAWLRASNLTPLQQRVFWKLVGFAIYRYFTGASNAAQVAGAASHGFGVGLTLDVAPHSGLRIFESFPSETYKATAGSPALALARQFATRKLVHLPAAPLHPTTFAAFGVRLQQVAQGVPGTWVRSPRCRVGDCLDSFASMMLGPWSMVRGLRARGTSLTFTQSEGTIVLPQ